LAYDGIPFALSVKPFYTQVIDLHDDPLKLSHAVGILLVVSGLFGVSILMLDQVLRSGASAHYDALIVFVVIDFLIGGLSIAKPGGSLMKVAAVWSALRILLQLGDVFLGPMYQFTYAQFADYLFNPASSLPASLGNPAGIPPIPIDLILLIDLAVLFMASKHRHSN